LSSVTGDEPFAINPIFTEDEAVVASVEDNKTMDPEELIKKDERCFHLLFKTIIEAVLLLDVDSRILFWNEAATKLFGYEREEALGKQAWSLLCAEDHYSLVRDHPTTDCGFNPEAGSISEFMMRRKDGVLIPVEVSRFRIKMGESLQSVVFLRDVRARKAAEQEIIDAKSRLEFILKSCRAAIYSAKPYGTYQSTYKSESIKDITGFEPSEFLGDPYLWLNRIHPDDVDYAYSEVENVFAKGKHEYEYRFLHKDGSYIWIRDEMRLVRDEVGNPKEIIGSMSDVTELRNAREQIERSREQLRSLAAQVELLREGERRAIAREIHDELGQALTGLKLDLKWLEKKPLSIEDDEIRERVNSMVEVVDSNIEIVRKISSRLRPHVLDDLGLAAAVDWQISEFMKKTKIDCSFRSEIYENKYDDHLITALFRILQEALTNVARHAGASRVEVDLYELDDHLVLEVRDNGRGIKVSELKDTSSLGILSMKERAFLQGGEVLIKSNNGKGTVVNAKVPIERRPSLDNLTQQSSDRVEGNRQVTRVMIVDDHAVVRRGLTLIINDENDMVLEAEARDAAEALMLVANRHIDIAVIDITMPRTSGVELLNELRSKRPDLPILVLSIHPEEQYAVRCLRAGALGYLKKDAAPDKLVEAIRLVAKGRKFITPAVAERLAEEVGPHGGEEPHARLSDREFEVARLIASGRSSGEIAEDLSLSIKTITTYRSRLLEKMGMNNNAEITRYVIEKHLL